MAKPEVKFDAALYTALFIDDDDVTEDIVALIAGLNVLESISSGIFFFFYRNRSLCSSSSSSETKCDLHRRSTYCR